MEKGKWVGVGGVFRYGWLVGGEGGGGVVCSQKFYISHIIQAYAS